jgi:hypothetical protein
LVVENIAQTLDLFLRNFEMGGWGAEKGLKNTQVEGEKRTYHKPHSNEVT